MDVAENNDEQFPVSIEEYQDWEEPFLNLNGLERSNQEFDAANEMIKKWLRDLDNNPKITRNKAVDGAQKLLISTK